MLESRRPGQWQQRGQCNCSLHLCRIATALYRRERTGKGSYVTTSLLAAGVWSASVFIQPPSVVRVSMGCTIEPSRKCSFEHVSLFRWHLFVLVATPDKVPAVLKAIGREDILTTRDFRILPSWRRTGHN